MAEISPRRWTRHWAWVSLPFVLGCGGSHPSPDTAPAGVQSSAEPLAGRAWLEESAKRASAAGAGPLQTLSVGAAAAGDHLPALVNVAAGRCALFLARGSTTVEDLDLFVYGDEGTQFGSDEAPDDHPALLVCPKVGRRLYVSARVAAGHGLVALGVQEVAPEAARDVARAARVRNAHGDAAGLAEAWPGLNEAIALHRRRLGGTWEDRRRVAVPVDARMPTHVSAHLEARTCLDALALTTDEVVELDLEVLDARGRIFGRGQGGLPRSLLVCSSEDAHVTLRLRPHQGQGTAVLALSSTRAGGDVDIDPEVPRAVLLKPARRAKTTPAGAKAPHPASDAVHGTARAGGRASVEVPWSGGCGRLELHSQGSLLGLEVFLWSPAGDLLASGAGLAEAVLFPCAPEGTLRLDVEATQRGGAFSVVPRPKRAGTGRPRGGPGEDDSNVETLAAHPLAASRLLARLHRAGHLEEPSTVGEVRAIPVTTTRLETLALTVPAQRCVEVFVGVGPGVLGVELRLVDGATGNEIELVRAASGASARACGATSPSVVAEIRASAGEGMGLVATRLLGGAPRTAPVAR